MGDALIMPNEDTPHDFEVVPDDTADLWVRARHHWAWLDVTLALEPSGPGRRPNLTLNEFPHACTHNGRITWPSGLTLDPTVLLDPAAHRYRARLGLTLRAISSTDHGWFRPLALSGHANLTARPPAHPAAAVAHALHVSTHDAHTLLSVYRATLDATARRILDLTDYLKDELGTSAHQRLTTPWGHARLNPTLPTTPLDAIRAGRLALVEALLIPHVIHTARHA